MFILLNILLTVCSRLFSLTGASFPFSKIKTTEAHRGHIYFNIECIFKQYFFFPILDLIFVCMAIFKNLN